MNLRSIDLNLLVVFEALIAERSVTRAAQKVGISPSAMSHGLRRLRSTFNDDLVMRTSRGLVPTRRALDLVDPIRAALKEIQYALGGELDVDPKTAARTFKIQFSNYFTACILPNLCERVRREAPGVKLIGDYLPQCDTLDLDDPGNIQLRVSSDLDPAAEYKRESVFEDRLVILMRRDHPAARQTMTPELFDRLTHLKPVTPASGENFVENFLARRGLSRRVLVEVPNSFLGIPIVKRTDLCAVIPELWTVFDPSASGLAVFPLPAVNNRFSVEQIWHRRKDLDPGHRWLRCLIAEVFRELQPISRRPQGRQGASSLTKAGTDLRRRLKPSTG